ncbi:DEAD/DEAH box helicase [Chitinivibrio alkaliphilus]|uniref:DEAD/DEAH box helicase n=1 Tax=Chitinivibrio alkaliphilus ACht1 TaxID=1313304 RepID=U7D849_9BACT|nr:DEAD/DEAH box helicase [Chitinivibrio alkaliphilus]ERP39130.1 DEAD/DEAH box helicase [Chitinivibrio alkaliphilus ACht1]
MNYRGLELDKFQEDAIQAIEENTSVLVSAPTGCGKTIVAEYAVEKVINEGGRVVYTAPIKALSNQKYRDFKLRFGDDAVGIHTGDLSINPDGQILVMTTEIFRNMILEGAQRLENVRYTVFDEVHFIDDEERGTVWEESIILAPKHIRFVCLSATVPNIDRLAEWMEVVREQKIAVVCETERPVPLKMHLFSAKYGPVSFDLLKERYVKNPKQRKRFRFRKPSPKRLIKNIVRKERDPILYFVFNRKGCEENARRMAVLNLLSDEEQVELDTMVDTLIHMYQIEDYSRLDNMERLWRRGIAYHHAGILPAAKEIVERLFATGLIKLLFCTETFALGVNMPARTVVFDDVEKFNGVEFQYLSNRSFQQMAGRAGRRGLDDIGHVYCHIIPETVEEKEIKRLFYTESEQVESRFFASYSTILSLYSRFGEEAFVLFRKSLRNFVKGTFHLSASYKKEEDQIRRRVRFLQKNGYLDGQNLTPKGRLASLVNGYEIQAAELYYRRIFDALSPQEICVVLGALITESRKKDGPLSDFEITTDGGKIIRKLRQKELKEGIKDPIPELDYRLAAPILSWVNGGSLGDLLAFGVPEGDLIRVLRMVVQLIRAIKANIEDPVTIEKLAECRLLINRGVVDAEAELKVESTPLDI